MTFGFFQDAAAGAGKRQRTQAALMDAAIAVIAEKGIEGAKISDVTVAAGLANGTFYNHFATKEDLLLQVARGIVQEVVHQLNEDMAEIDDGPHRVVTATARFVDLMLREPDWAAMLLSGANELPDLTDDIFAFIRNDVQMGIDQGRFDAATDLFTLGQVVALIANATKMQLATGTQPALTHRLCENVLRVLGMTPAKAKQAVRRAFDAMPSMAAAK